MNSLLKELKHIKNSYLFWDKEYLDWKIRKKINRYVFSLQYMKAFPVAIFLSAMSLNSLEIQAFFKHSACYSRKWTWHCLFNFQMRHFSDA